LSTGYRDCLSDVAREWHAGEDNVRRSLVAMVTSAAAGNVGPVWLK
jgi:hypothetical protein